jgi:hypothetical protein
MVGVTLNIYDLPSIQVPGFGAHHSGVEIIGVEYTFSSNAGVCEMTPREAPDCRFREAKPLGNTSLSPVEVQRAIDRLRTSWTGDTYDVLLRNCNHFADALCRELLGVGIPGYVNRLARIGSLARCCIPKSLRQGQQDQGLEQRLLPAAQPAMPAFSGEGRKLGGGTNTVMPSWMRGARTGEDRDARELRLAAALQRQNDDGPEISTSDVVPLQLSASERE